MPRYELIRYTAAPGRLGSMTNAYRETVLPRLAECRLRLSAAWTCEFGVLNRLLTLCQQGDGDGDSDNDSDAAARDAPAAFDGKGGHIGQIAEERTSMRLRRTLNTAMPCGVVEFRTYSIEAGQTETYLAKMLASLHYRERHSPNIGVFTTTHGDVDRVLHFWGYPDIADRMRARSAAYQDPDWAAYIATVYPYLRKMESQILLPTAFSPLK
jgi:hypothetical protein